MVLVGHATIEEPFKKAAPDPASRRIRARSRRALRLSPQTNGVGSCHTPIADLLPLQLLDALSVREWVSVPH